MFTQIVSYIYLKLLHHFPTFCYRPPLKFPVLFRSLSPQNTQGLAYNTANNDNEESLGRNKRHVICFVVSESLICILFQEVPGERLRLQC